MKKLVPYLLVVSIAQKNLKLHSKRSLITIERGIPNESRKVFWFCASVKIEKFSIKIYSEADITVE